MDGKRLFAALLCSAVLLSGRAGSAGAGNSSQSPVRERPQKLSRPEPAVRQKQAWDAAGFAGNGACKPHPHNAGTVEGLFPRSLAYELPA